MKKIILIVAVATMIAGVVFVACQKEITKTDKKEVIKQGVKQQKMGIPTIIELPEEPINEIFDVLYSYDGIEFFNENGDIVTTIHVKFDEANKKAVTGGTKDYQQHIVNCDDPGNTCGHATVWDDETTMSWDARYAVCDDGRIIIERYCL